MKICILVVLLVFAGCARRESDSTVAIQDAVFRFQFGHNASVQQKRADIYFLAFGDPHERSGAEDPSEVFLARFSGLKPRIAKYSDAGTDNGWVIDKKSKEGGIIFFVHSVRIIDENTAEAKGGYHEDKRSASGNTYRLKFGWRGWRVVGGSMDWISENRPNQSLQPTGLLARG